jgi:hypothetical protein
VPGAGRRAPGAIRLVVGGGQTPPVDAQERDRRGKCEALVPVDQRMVAGEGVQQSGGLGTLAGVCVLAEGAGLWSRERRLQRPVVSDHRVAESVRAAM